MTKQLVTIDGSEAAAYIAHKVSEVCIIYPITPSSTMGELADQWSSQGRRNIWGSVPEVVEMQSEGGASGAMHGAVQTGALAATFTASQGLLLMIPNMYKIAGELTPTVFHVSARSLATHALSIFGDHADVMAVRSTGFGLLASSSVQEVADMALVAHAASLRSRIPFVHFFDGFRTSHEVNKIELISDDDIRAMMPEQLITEHRARGLSPDHPVVRGTAQNPDVYFQCREACNAFYDATPEIVQQTMDQLGALTGRHYQLFDYAGHPEAERVIVLMGSGVGPVKETVAHLQAQGEKVGVINVHLFRPFSIDHLLAALPKTVETIAVLDRTKEPGAPGEPLYLDIIGALAEAEDNGKIARRPRVVGGRYGLSSKEFTPAMVSRIFAELSQPQPRNHFTIGIHDDLGGTSLDYDNAFVLPTNGIFEAMFYGLGSDGTVGANKNSIKIIGGETENYAQGYFVYDSKKSGSQTVSHLRFGPEPIGSSYLVQSARFVGCHQFNFLERTDVLANIVDGGTFLLNAPYAAEDVWQYLPRQIQQTIIDKSLKFYVIDGHRVALDTGMGERTNTIMQTCFFAISGVLPREEAIDRIKESIRKTYGRKGEDIVKKNFAAVDASLANLHQVQVPATAGDRELPPVVSPRAPEFVRNVTARIIAGEGDALPTSALPVDGTWPTGTAKWEKRNIAQSVPIWEPEICTQCGNCSLICPHSCIRINELPAAELAAAPAGFKSIARKGRSAAPDQMYVLQVAVEDCTGCTLCVGACPAKDKTAVGRKAINMGDKTPILEQERENLIFFESLPMPDRKTAALTTVKGVQFLEPLFEYCGACTGCGETPYVRLMTQLFGDRAVIANATGCSSIYGGNLPTTPYTVNADGRGPSWSNSLFEDNAEFGFGFRLSFDKHRAMGLELLKRLRDDVGPELATGIAEQVQHDEAGLAAQRARVAELKAALQRVDKPEARQLLALADDLVKRSVWIVGGDGWAYDIGYGGLDHVLASGRNVNVLVLDTEVYSNTGGQMSKATPRAAVAKFAASGKRTAKKDLGMLAVSYGHVYVAQVAIGADPRQTLKAFNEAEAWDGPSMIIAYSHCIAHGINLAHGPRQQELAVNCGYWPLYRYNPATPSDKNPFVLDSKPPTVKFQDYAYNELRYSMLRRADPETAQLLMAAAQADITRRWRQYQQLAEAEI